MKNTKRVSYEETLTILAIELALKKEIYQEIHQREETQVNVITLLRQWASEFEKKHYKTNWNKNASTWYECIDKFISEKIDAYLGAR